MDNDPNEIHSETDDARAGSTPHIVRWVLGISLLAAIVLLSIIWITGAALQGEPESATEVRARVLQEYGDHGGVLAGDGDDTAASQTADSESTGAAAPPTAAN